VDRWLDLGGCDNIRDLGGLPTIDGRTTRYGHLLRSDTLQDLTPADVDRLRDSYRLRTVVDLRAPAEAAREGRGPLAHVPVVAYHNLSFLPGEWIMPDDPRFPAIVRDLDSVDRVEHYLDYLRLAADRVADAIRLLADEGNGPTVFHCAAGKDRTGALAALVLSIVGVGTAAVVADYALTNERLPKVDARLAGRPSYNHPGNPLTLDALRCRPEVMGSFLERVELTWGGAWSWARAAGVTEAELRALRTRLVG
jgi:hypothetical protein